MFTTLLAISTKKICKPNVGLDKSGQQTSIIIVIFGENCKDQVNNNKTKTTVLLPIKNIGSFSQPFLSMYFISQNLRRKQINKTNN